MLDWLKRLGTAKAPPPPDDATVNLFASHDPAPPAEAPVTQVGPYRILCPLGQGGMARVYVAREGDGPEVALKVLQNADDDEQTRFRFHREFEIGQQIKHPHVCSVLAFGETPQGTSYFVMELLIGETLLHRVDRLAPMPVGLARPLMEQILIGLAAIHEVGVVHRDLKPANVFITTDEVVKIMDFGIAHSQGMARITRTGSVFGTLQFMSPEQVMDAKHVDHRTDLFNVGLIAYQLLTRHLPLEGTTDKVLPALVRGELTPISAHRDDLPASVEAWLSRLLSPKPEDRYQSAKEAREAMAF